MAAFGYGNAGYPHFNCNLFYSLLLTPYSLVLTNNPSTYSPQMASGIPKPQKRIVDFLNEQQDPFILEEYLSERDYSKRWSLNEDSGNSSEKPNTSGLSKKKKALLPFCNVLKALCNKLAFHKESKKVVTKDHDKRNKHASVPELDWVDNIVQFSSASSSMFSSCSVVDEEGTSISSHKYLHSLYSHTICNKGPQRRKRKRCIEGSHESLGKIPVRRVPNVKQRRRSCSVLLPKKIAENTLLSAAIWSGLLGQSMNGGNCTKELGVLLPGAKDVSQILKSRRVLHGVKKMLFDCMKDITITLPTQDDRNKGYKQFMGPLDLGKLIRQRTKEWGQQVGDGANLTYLLTLDYLNSIMEWGKFEPYVKDIVTEITDAILDSINNEIVLEMIRTLTPNT